MAMNPLISDRSSKSTFDWSPGMVDIAPSNATNPAPSPLPTSSQRGNPLIAGGSAQPFSMMPPQPQQKQDNPLLRGIGAFAKGLAPEAFAEGQQRAAEARKAELGKFQQMLTNAKAWTAQALALPDDQIGQFFMQNADQIAATTGQDVRSIQNVTRAGLQQQMASLDAMLGQVPEDPTYMNLGGGAVGKVANGKFSMERDAPMAPAKPTVVNNRVLDPNDPTKVLADYSDDQQEKPPWIGATKDANGNWVWDENYIKGYRQLHPQQSGRADNYGFGPAPAGYRWKPDGTQEKIPGGPADKPPVEYTATQANKFTQQAGTLDALEGALTQYEDLIQTTGPQFWTSGKDGDNPEAKALDAARTAVDIQIKELFNLGVLNGPDLDIIRGAIPDVTGVEALGKNPQSVLASTSVIHDYINRGRQQVPQQFIDKARPNGAPVAPNVQRARAILQNWDQLPPAMKTQDMRAYAERIAGRAENQQPQGQQDQGGDADIEAILNEALGPDEMDAPDGVDPEDWKHLTPEEQQQYLAGTQ